MKTLRFVLTLCTVVKCLEVYSQSDVDLKIDSLTVELNMLQQEKVAIESQIRVINSEIAKLSRRRLNQFDTPLTTLTCAYSSGCSLMAEPSPSSRVLQKVPYGKPIEVDAQFFRNEYVKASYSDEVGYLYFGVLQKTQQLEDLVRSNSSSSLEEITNKNNSGQSADSSYTRSGVDKSNIVPSSSSGTYRSPGRGSYHSIQTGPRGGKYYINKNGRKTYVKKK